MISLKEWIRTYYGSQSKMDTAMGWSNRTASRYLNHEPHRFFEVRRLLHEQTGLQWEQLVRMIDARELELLAKQEHRRRDAADETVVALSHREHTECQ